MYLTHLVTTGNLKCKKVVCTGVITSHDSTLNKLWASVSNYQLFPLCPELRFELITFRVRCGCVTSAYSCIPLHVMQKHYGVECRVIFTPHIYRQVFPTPQPLRAVQVLFSPMASGWWSSGQWDKACLGCFSERVRFKMLILARDIS